MVWASCQIRPAHTSNLHCFLGRFWRIPKIIKDALQVGVEKMAKMLKYTVNMSILGEHPTLAYVYIYMKPAVLYHSLCSNNHPETNYSCDDYFSHLFQGAKRIFFAGMFTWSSSIKTDHLFSMDPNTVWEDTQPPKSYPKHFLRRYGWIHRAWSIPIIPVMYPDGNLSALQAESSSPRMLWSILGSSSLSSCIIFDSTTYYSFSMRGTTMFSGDITEVSRFWEAPLFTKSRYSSRVDITQCMTTRSSFTEFIITWPGTNPTQAHKFIWKLKGGNPQINYITIIFPLKNINSGYPVGI